jgi:hypothetical protein
MNIPTGAYKTKWTAERRRNLAKWQFAGTDGESFPIADQKDVEDAWDLRGHDDDPKKCGENILRIAAKLGLKKPAAAEDDDDSDDAEKSVGVISFGEAVKASAKDPYKLDRAYLVLFSTAGDPDLVGEFFTAKTDFGDHQSTRMYYDHGLDPTVGKSVIGTASYGVDKKGVWVDGQLDKANRYAKDVSKLAASGKLGWSSGTASHVVEREDVLNDHGVKTATWIKKWDLGLDASLTPTPCEPRTRPDIVPIKSYASSASFKGLTEGMRDEASESGIQTDPGLGDYTYSNRPTAGPLMTSRMACEHGDLCNTLIRNRTINAPEYAHMQKAFGDSLTQYHTGLNGDVAGREMDDWVGYIGAYKAVDTSKLNTIGDAIKATMIRCHNAGTDHLLTRGVIDADEHEALAEHFRQHLDQYLDEVHPTILERSLRENGSGYLPMKSFAESPEGRDLKASEQFEELLDGAENLRAQAAGFKTRMEGIKATRASSGKDLGPSACKYLSDSATSLEVTAQNLRDLIPAPVKTDAQKALSDARVTLARLALAG